MKLVTTAWSDRMLFRKIQKSIAQNWYETQRQRGASDDFNNYSRQELIAGYYLPLLILLREYVTTNKEELKSVFIEELYRYIVRINTAEEQRVYLIGLLAGFINEIQYDRTSTLLDAMKGALDNIKADFESEHSRCSVSVVALGDCLMTDLRAFLRPTLNDRLIACDMHCLYFGSAQGGRLSTDAVLEMITVQKADILALSFLTYDGLPFYRIIQQQSRKVTEQELIDYADNIISIMEQFIQGIRSQSNITILLHNVCGLPLTRLRQFSPLLPAFSKATLTMLRILNERIVQLRRRTSNCLLIDEMAIVEKYGARECNKNVIPRPIRKASFFHRRLFGHYLSRLYATKIDAYARLRGIKLLAVDFDNTLWKGVMADGDVEHYGDRQQLLRRLKEAGILLAAVTKNTEQNIRWNEMGLSRDDFVSLKINWNLKPQSIEELAAELNLGKESFLLIDDNPVERELVTSNHPMVRAMDANDPATWQALEMMFDFPSTSDTEEARHRTEMYRTQANRSHAVSSYGGDYANMMKSLELKLAFRTADSKDIPRCHELAQRTNQFNTTTIRYREEELIQMLKSPERRLYVGELSDKFGNLGIVVLSVVKLDPNVRIFENCVMSCRAMGFGVEKVFMQKVMRAQAWQGDYIGNFVPSAKNQPASTFYKELGFEEREGAWRLDAGSPLQGVPDWFSIKSSD